MLYYRYLLSLLQHSKFWHLYQELLRCLRWTGIRANLDICLCLSTKKRLRSDPRIQLKAKKTDSTLLLTSKQTVLKWLYISHRNFEFPATINIRVTEGARPLENNCPYHQEIHTIYIYLYVVLKKCTKSRLINTLKDNLCQHYYYYYLYCVRISVPQWRYV